MRVLVIDTCGAEASVALADGASSVAEVMLPGRSASERLVGVIREMLAGRGWRVSELDAVGVVRGPGSFTGVRVGLSAAKGLAEGAELRLVAVSRLEVLLEKGALAGQPAMAALDAGRGEFFWSELRAERETEQGIGDAEEVRSRAEKGGFAVVCETGTAERLGGGGLVVVEALRARDALAMVRRRLECGELDDPLLLDALYLHSTEQEMLDRQRRHRELKLTKERA